MEKKKRIGLWKLILAVMAAAFFAFPASLYCQSEVGVTADTVKIGTPARFK